MAARHGTESRSGTRSFVSKPDLVSPTLIYPVTVTTDSTSSYGLSVTTVAASPVGQQALQVKDSSGTILFTVPIVGPIKVKGDLRSAHSVGGSYMALNGTQSPPCLEFPDGASSQGSKLWSGTDVPSATTVGAATAGDYYFRRLGGASLIAASHSSIGATNTAINVGSGTPGTNITFDLSATPAAGDLMVILALNGNATETCTIGSDTGITDSATDGGVLENDGTRRAHIFSHVIQTGDISSNNVNCSAFTNTTGAYRRLFAYLFRHTLGFPTTGSKHGCPITSTTFAQSGTTNATLTVTGPSGPSVSVAAAVGGLNSSVSPGYAFLWDAGSTSNETSDTPGGTITSGAAVSARPGYGTNTSGTAGYTGGGSSVVIANQSGATAYALGNWATNSGTIPTLYVCTVAGSPGTWISVF